MTIAAGTRLGPYEVIAPVGAGGMGEVYRGTDTRLDRVVAIKVVAPEFAQRFEREAKSISALNHPHICTLYDVGPDYLVMEFVEGESLEQRLRKGPLPMDQVFRYGIEIGDALDKAHRAGIIHRDLKPGNIMITKSGAKLLDFGLAKTNTVLSPQSSVLETQHKPLTQEGTILGTFQYMAPEQLEGLEADARTDIFAFGAVLYEMATGRRAFEGKTKTSLIAAIVDRDPPAISSIQPMTPPAFERVVKMCLAKDPDDRWQNARDIANELRWIQQGSGVERVRARRNVRETIGWSVAIVALVALATLAYFYRRATAEPPRSVQSSLLPPEKTTFVIRGPTGGFAVSPDGRKIAFVANGEGKTMLWLRPLHTLAAQPLLGTEGAAFPFWSPDSRYVAFFSSGKLRKMDTNGGPPQTICDVGSQPRGGTWSKDDVIVFAPNTREGLWKVSAAGGTPVAVTKLPQGEFSHRYPSFLPDGRHFLFIVQRVAAVTVNDRNLASIASIDGSERRVLFPVSGEIYYSEPGFLMFPRDTTLFAQRFDRRTMQTAGEAFPIADRVSTFTTTLHVMFSISASGEVLAYQRAQDITGLQLVWVDRGGKELEAVTPPGNYDHPSLSHDGKRVAYEQTDPGAGIDIWVLDLLRHVPTRLTFDPEDEIDPVWSPDDSKIAYGGPQSTGMFDLMIKPPSGTAPAEHVWTNNGVVYPSQWTADNAILVWLVTPKTQGGFDIARVSLADRKMSNLVTSKSDDVLPQLSPDGKWLLYTSNTSGSMNVYIEPYPPTGAKWQVSANGGLMPKWRRDSKEVFFLTPDEKLMSATVNATPSGLEISTPVALFTTRLRQTNGYQYDVSADGKRFLLNAAKGGDENVAITLVTNWTSSLAR